MASPPVPTWGRRTSRHQQHLLRIQHVGVGYAYTDVDPYAETVSSPVHPRSRGVGEFCGTYLYRRWYFSEYFFYGQGVVGSFGKNMAEVDVCLVMYESSVVWARNEIKRWDFLVWKIVPRGEPVNAGSGSDFNINQANRGTIRNVFNSSEKGNDDSEKNNPSPHSSTFVYTFFVAAMV